MTTFCVHCGKVCQSGDAFCANCGTEISRLARPVEGNSQGQPVKRMANEKSFSLVLALSAVGLIVALTLNRTTVPESDSEAGFEVSRVSDAVLTLTAYDDSDTVITQGSGFIIRDDGLAVTNWHVAENATTMAAVTGDGRTYFVDRIVNVDAAADLVLLQLADAQDGEMRTARLSFADSRRVAVGQRVYTVSAPEGLSQTLSDGLISALRTYEGHQFIQISAPVSHGSSGAPVFNAAGEVVGVIRGKIESGENLNFAIPIDSVVRLAGSVPATLAATSLPRQDRDSFDLPVLFGSAISGGLPGVHGRPAPGRIRKPGSEPRVAVDQAAGDAGVQESEEGLGVLLRRGQPGEGPAQRAAGAGQPR